MNDSISRQSAINAIENTDCELSPYDWNELTDAIMQLPSAEPKGRWIGNYCSECGEPKMDWFINKTKRWAAFNYCPNCGAKMEVDE